MSRTLSPEDVADPIDLASTVVRRRLRRDQEGSSDDVLRLAVSGDLFVTLLLFAVVAVPLMWVIPRPLNSVGRHVACSVALFLIMWPTAWIGAVNAILMRDQLRSTYQGSTLVDRMCEPGRYRQWVVLSVSLAASAAIGFGLH